MIHHHDEADLQRKIVEKLNANGYHFEITPVDFDAVDSGNALYLEVKRDDLAPAQLLYACGRVVVEPNFLLLANATELRVYKGPSKDVIAAFVQSVDPTRSLAPSAVNSTHLTGLAMELLGDHVTIWDYTGPFTVYDKKHELFITKDNFSVVESVLAKYTINPLQFVKYIATVYTSNQKIVVNSSGKIINIDTGEFFTQPSGESSPIKNIHDKQLIECLRVRAKDVKDILRADGANETIQERRQGGRFFTKDTIAKTVTDIVDGLKPEYIVEPYVGAGSLIEGLVGKYPGSANDINKDDVDVLRRQYEGLPWKFTNLDMFATPTEVLIEKMGIPRDKMVVFVTNPPWGVSNIPNKFSSTKEEQSIPSRSRKLQIDYGDLGDMYGRGDLILPAIGRMVEIIKTLGHGYLLTFSLFGVFCGKRRYNKLLKKLLSNFKFIKGYILNGDCFVGTSKKIPISLSVWSYGDGDKDLLKIMFDYNGLSVHFNNRYLFKDIVKNSDRIISESEIGSKFPSMFNDPGIKRLYSKGFSLLSSIVKTDLELSSVPTELAYSLWSHVIGMVNHPIQFEGAYIHIPDFTLQGNMEILTYATIETIMYESMSPNKYCNGLIGFVGMSRVFKFGNERLTNGAQYLIDTYGDAPVGDTTIRGVFDHMMDTPNETDEYRLSTARLIKEQIATRLDVVGYWDYIPIPMDF